MYTPKYSITNKILKHVGVIEACREVVDHAPLLPYYEKEFRKDALVRTVHHGTHIEGNELNLTQAEQAMFGHEVMARERDIQEVINYRGVMEYIENLKTQMSNVKSEIDEEFVENLHKMIVEKILEPERSGVYRTTQVVVRNSMTGEVTFTPPVALAVPYQVKELIDFVNKSGVEDIHPVLKSGVSHYELVRIHPFVDGNGRVARVLSTFILFQSGYDIRRFFSLEEYFDNDAARYYTSLQSVEKNNGDLTAWLEYFTEGLAIELTKIKEKVEKISVDGKLRERLGGKPVMLSDRQLKIIEYIQKTGYLANTGFKTLFPFVSEDTVLNELKSLIKHGIVKKQGSTKAAKYIMS
jgi:Fic family protein